MSKLYMKFFNMVTYRNLISLVFFLDNLKYILGANESTKLIKKKFWIGQPILLNCTVSRTDKDEIIWKKGGEIISFGNVLMISDDRIDVSVLPTLKISSSTPSDEGEYACSIKQPKPTWQIYKVTMEDFSCKPLPIPLFATITYWPEILNRHSYPRGATATYKCVGNYSLVGKDKRTCSNHELGWSGKAPVCLSKDLAAFQSQLDSFKDDVEERLLGMVKLFTNQSNEKSDSFNEELNKLQEEFTTRNKLVDNEIINLRKLITNSSSYFSSTDNIKELNFYEELRRLNKTLREANESFSDNVTLLSAVLTELSAEQANLARNTRLAIMKLGQKTSLKTKELENLLSRFNETQLFDTSPENLSFDIAFLNSSRYFGNLQDSISVIDAKMQKALSIFDIKIQNLNDRVEENFQQIQASMSNNTFAQVWENSHREVVARQVIVNGQLISEHVWIVHNIDALIKRVPSPGLFSLQSAFFYTGIPGYRMRLVLYPNFEMSKYIGMYAGLVKGEFDDILPWPFSHEYSLTFISHIPTMKDYTGTIKMPAKACNPANFFKPEDETPSACGFKHFMSHDMLNEKKSAYTVNGNIFVRARIIVRI